MDKLSLCIQLITAILILATFWVYFFQLRTMKNGAIGQNSISLINYIQDERTRAARETVMKVLKTKSYEDWTDEEKNTASRVCSNYDVVSILIYKQKLISPEIIVDNWGPSIIKCYTILQPHVQEMKKNENSGPGYWDDFTKLYNEAVSSGKFDYLLNSN